MKASSILLMASQVVRTKNLLAARSAKRVTTSLLLLAVVSCSFFSCTKSGLKPTPSDQVLASSGGHGGGNSGGGNGGGGGDNNPTQPSAPAPTTTPTDLTISEVVTNGTWKLYSYIEKTENSTKKFSNFSFTFKSDRTMTAQEGNKVTPGTWRPAEAVFYYGIPQYGYDPHGFFITLGSGLPLSLLSKNFFVSFKGVTTFTLESINPAEDTHITFTR